MRKIIILLIISFLIIPSAFAFFGVDAYGKKNVVAKFINGEDLGNSSIVDDGNSVNISNPIYVAGSQVCTADNGLCSLNGSINATDLTNVAFVNQSNTFTEKNIFTKNTTFYNDTYFFGNITSPYNLPTEFYSATSFGLKGGVKINTPYTYGYYDQFGIYQSGIKRFWVQDGIVGFNTGELDISASAIKGYYSTRVMNYVTSQYSNYTIYNNVAPNYNGHYYTNNGDQAIFSRFGGIDMGTFNNNYNITFRADGSVVIQPATYSGANTNIALIVNGSSNFMGNINAHSYTTNGSDFCEIIPKLDMNEEMYLSDVVCIVEGGKATKIMSNCIDYGVVSGSTAGYIGGSGDIYEYIKITEIITREECSDTSANVTIYNPENASQSNTIERSVLLCLNRTFTNTYTRKYIDDNFTNNKDVPIAFSGIINVKVTGSCSAGYWLKPSGNNDGTAKCIDTTSANTAQFVDNVVKRIGVAWETNTTAGTKYVKTRIGSR